MSYNTRLQNNNTSLEGNNTDLQSILNTINNLPTAGSGESVNLDTEITTQDALIAELSTILESKTANAIPYNTCTIVFKYDPNNNTEDIHGKFAVCATTVENNALSYAEDYFSHTKSGEKTSITIPNVLCGTAITFIFFSYTLDKSNCYFWRNGYDPMSHGGREFQLHPGESFVSHTIQVPDEPNEIIEYYFW